MYKSISLLNLIDSNYMPALRHDLEANLSKSDLFNNSTVYSLV